MDVLINELSLDGQFECVDDFVDSLEDFIRIMKIADEKSITVLKKYDLYARNITKAETLRDIITIKGNDKVRRIKSLLLRTSNNPPYWEEDQKHKQDSAYAFEHCEDLFSCSLAEALERDRTVISFKHALYMDKHIKVTKDNTEFEILNAAKAEYFIEFIHKVFSIISRIEFFTYKYHNTRLSFDKFHEEYGFEQLEANELDMVIEAFDRFIQQVDWNSIHNDRSFNYKDYSPGNKKDNWFSGTAYEKTRIFKFRCGNTAVAPIRCFGFREGDTFFALRIERDHKISNNG